MRLSFFSELQNPAKSHITTYLSQRLKSIGFFKILKEGTTKGSEGKKYFFKTHRSLFVQRQTKSNQQKTTKFTTGDRDSTSSFQVSSTG